MSHLKSFFEFRRKIKILISVIVLLLLCVNVNARQISSSEAKTVALNWINTVGDKYYTSDEISKIYTRQEKGVVGFYIVSFKSTGWVIVSGTDLVDPVLGYSLTTTFDMRLAPPQVKAWLDGRVEEISYAIDSKAEAKREVVDKWNEYGARLLKKSELRKDKSAGATPLIKTTWDQGRNYNEMAPYDESSSAGNNHVWIGCVATAMAQVMKYWSYPDMGMGSHSYTHPTYGLLSADFGNTVYDWGSMPNFLTTGNAEVQKISYHCAVSVDMDFGPGGSGAFLDEAMAAYKEYFRYNIAACASEKSRWLESEWTALLKRDIDMGRPVVYSGYNQSLSSGHAFVCDGYNANDYFHFNWGWSGVADGYFLLTSLTPGGRNYSYQQAAVFGIEPVMPAYFGIPYSEGFEDGNGGKYSLYGVNSITTAESHSGNKSLMLGSNSFKHDMSDAASICFTVPPDAELSFWVKRSTPVESVLNNQMAMLMPMYGSSALIEFFNGDYNDEEWVNYHIDLSAYTGQLLRLVFMQNVSDILKYQWMYIDDITISGVNNNLAPFKPANPNPADNSKYISLYPVLKWSGGDPNDDDLIYDVYFGTSNPPPLVASVFENRYTTPALIQKKQYYWKIVSKDSEFTSEGDVWTFTTKGIPPVVEECGVTAVTGTTAEICGNIVRTNGSEILEKGICWSLNQNPNVYSATRKSESESLNFSCTAEELFPYTKYYYKAYARSEEGIGYSNEGSFRTSPGLPVVSRNNVLDVRRNSVKIVGNLDVLNDTTIFRTGVVWSVKQGFSIEEATRVEQDCNMMNPAPFNVNLRNVPGPAMIFFKVFAENSAGVAYSDEGSFETTNAAPFIDLDENNSSLAWGCNFKGKATEQMPGGVIADKDVLITDEDGDSIRAAVFTLNNQIKGSNEFLYLDLIEENCIINGNGTNKIEIFSDSLSNEDWGRLIGKVEYRNNYDSPGEKTDRHIKVFVSDGADSSNLAVSTIEIIPVNDAPVNKTLPVFESVPSYNQPVSIIKGEWTDEADETDGTFTYSYSLQKRNNEGEIVDTIHLNGSGLVLGEDICGFWLRIEEKVTDKDNGGSNEASSTVYGEWVKVERANQTIEFDLIPVCKFDILSYKLTGSTSSGFPVTYTVPKNDKTYVSNDTAYFTKIGKTVISAIQEGNSCFYPSETKFRILNVEAGNQIIENLDDQTLPYNQKWFKIPVASSSGLQLEIESSNLSVAEAMDDTLHFKGTGTTVVTLSQPGNLNYAPAEDIVFNLTVTKGFQKIFVDVEDTLYYGSIGNEFSASSSSGLPVAAKSLNAEVVDLKNGEILINKTGEATLKFSQPGNNIWEAAEDIYINIKVQKDKPVLYFRPIEVKKFNDSPFIPEVISSVDDKVNISVDDTSIAKIIDGKVVIQGCGETYITAFLQGDENREDATARVELKVIKADQQITFNNQSSFKFGDNPFELNATASSGLKVSYRAGNEDVISINGNTAEIKGAGESYIEALQEGDKNWNPAETVKREIKIEKADQQISFSIPDTITLGSQPVAADAVSSSGLPVNITSEDENILKVSDNKLLTISAGVTGLSMKQPGDKNYNPTEAKTQIYVIDPLDVASQEVIKFKIYPNPARDNFNIQTEVYSNVEYEVVLVNLTGNIIGKWTLNGNSNNINIQNIRGGVYFIEIRIMGRRFIQKLIIAD